VMRFGLRLPSFALGARTTSLAAMGSYLARAEALGFEAAVTLDGDELERVAAVCDHLGRMHPSPRGGSPP
jgi:hypothetical protein